MSDIQFEDILAAMGLQGAAVGPPEAIPRPESAVGHGFVAAHADSGVALPADSREASAVGMAVERDAGRLSWLRIRAVGDRALSVRGAEGDAAIVVGEGAVEIDEASLSAPFAILGEDHVGLLIRPGLDGGAVVAHELVMSPLSVTGPLELDVDVASWLSGADAWLADAARKRSSGGDTWSAVVALGMVLRLERPEGRAMDEAMEDLLTGREPAGMRRMREWCTSLTPQQREDLEELALGAVDGLRDTLDEVADAVDPEDPAWVSAYQRLLHARDEAEGVARLLAMADSDARLRVALASVDEAASEWIAAFPEVDGLADEHLARAAVDAPDAWWTRAALGAEAGA